MNQNKIKPSNISCAQVLMRFLILSVIILCVGCPSPPEPSVEKDTSIFLELLDTWTTSVTMRVYVADTTEVWSFALERNDSTIFNGLVRGVDTTLVDTMLQMGTNYSYKAYFIESQELVDSSDIIFTTTIAPTSHDVIWEVDILGLAGSRLNAVEAMSEDNIWVVGEIWMPDPDSSYDGSGKELFNVAHWDGIQWDTMAAFYGVPLYSVKFFAEDDIWVTSFGFPLHWDGSGWTLYQLQEMGLDVSAGFDLWGKSPDEIFFVGYSGGIVKYNGSSFTKIETNSDVNYMSISGSLHNVLVAGYDGLSNSELLLLNTTSHALSQIFYGPPNHIQGELHAYSGPLTSVYACDNHRFLIASTYGLYLFDDRKPAAVNLLPIDPNNLSIYFSGFPTAIDGSFFNNVFIVGHRSSIYHFNGVDYYQYPTLVEASLYFDVSVKNDLAVAVGFEQINGKAIVVKGRKQ